MSEKPIYVLNGPNLNLLGAREPEIYGTETLGDIEQLCANTAKAAGKIIVFRQSNAEGELIDWVQEAAAKGSGLVINPGGYTHSSVALHDALAAANLPKIELHLSNIHSREAFRRQSVTAAAVNGVIMGLGAAGYPLAISSLVRIIEGKSKA